ncbi:MAG: hypothetical protein Q4C12_01560 [Clostridia bacterium]|nr:hypothetical protein [Clostridia bacterium]
MKKAKRRPLPDEFLDEFGVAVSTTECTGFLPIPPQTQAEYEAYRELYEFAPPFDIETEF